MMKKAYSRGRLLLLVSITLILSGCSEEDDQQFLRVDPSELNFTIEGGTLNAAVSSNAQWTVSNVPSWLSCNPSTGEGEVSLAIHAQAHPGEEGRSAMLIISNSDISRQIKIYQEGATDSDPPEFQYDIPPDATGMRDMRSTELSALMSFGWNIGNSLDAIGGETAWGNPLITQQLIDSVNAAGFNAIRLPVAWSKFSDESSFTIDSDWLNRVEEVVNYILNNDMFVIMNIHWDGGWMQPTYKDEAYVNNRLSVMWKQIATHFRDYDDRLLFAGTNEVMVEDDYGEPTQEYYTVQNGFNQTFVTAVRSTGGRNAYRHLVVQGFNTNIDFTIKYAVIPQDVTPDRLMMEVHYYDPYNFTLNENSSIIQWGASATDPAKTETWANETYVDSQFSRMKTNFIDKGIPVILGEFGAISRTNLDDENEAHAKYRRLYFEYVTQSARSHELIPFYWDNGYTGNYGFGVFDRSTGTRIYPELIEALVSPQ